VTDKSYHHDTLTLLTNANRAFSPSYFLSISSLTGGTHTWAHDGVAQISVSLAKERLERDHGLLGGCLLAPFSCGQVELRVAFDGDVTIHHSSNLVDGVATSHRELHTILQLSEECFN